MDTFTKVFQWFVYSSADPSKISLTVRAALLGIVPIVLNVVSVACGVGIACLGIDAASLNSVIEAITNIVYAGLSIVASVGVAYGFVRKIFLTVQK